MTPRTPPAVNATKPAKLPAVLDTTLPNGLRVIAARKPGVPMVQARLRVDGATKADLGVLTDVFANTMLTGTKTRSEVDIADEMQRLGGEIWAADDVDNLFLSGITLADDLGKFLSLLADVVHNATHAEDEVVLAKAQAEQGIAIMRSQPAARAQYAIGERVFPHHPYGRPMPTVDMVGSVTRAAVRRFHKTMLTPDTAMLVMVGDVTPAKMVAAADKALGGWTGKRKAFRLPTPAPVVAGPVQIVHQPGAVQTNVRLGGIGIGRSHVDFPALTLALTILGGGFTSRLNHNLREDKGYTYGASAGISHNAVASMMSIGADVQTAVTAPAFVETFYELGRMATGAIGEDELADAKRYLAGNMALSVETQVGLVTYLTQLAISGLDVSYLKEFPARANAESVDDVAAAAAKYVAPSTLATVLVGDADQIGDAVGRLVAVEVID